MSNHVDFEDNHGTREDDWVGVAAPFGAEKSEKLGEAEASKGLEECGMPVEAEELAQPVLEAYGDDIVDEIGVEMDCLAAGVAVSDIGGHRRPASGLAALVTMGMAKGPACFEEDAAFAGRRDSDCGRNCEGGCEDLDADVDAGTDGLGGKGQQQEEGVVGDEEEEEEKENRGRGSAVAGAWL
ncbi:uncharacterized protein Triagg1_8591 [Trichoderma aggressivum f. europaeum]|uniref:Uncharacterized protein n=1 Tax=Trichoderma aggressivum f. europaeum TaxID=173218 RepID=A0AAE1J3I4_9HYPO|nr:hypothetical protein Triagg1_8591 [Trichoderma aggressivum f. europaeum]